MVVRAHEGRMTKKKRLPREPLRCAPSVSRRVRFDFRQKILRRPIAMPVWLLRPGSSTFAAPFVLLKSMVP